MRDYMIVGLTGPTGAGKSTVSQLFEKNGFAVINADSIARDIMAPNGVCVGQLALAFGRDVVSPDGSLNRRQLAEKAFSSPESTRLLNDITHPQIFLRTLKMCREYIDSGKRKIVFDAPVLFESNSDLMCDCIVAVIAPAELRINRLMKRDGASRAELERRISAQKSDDFYKSRADFVIDGGAELGEVLRQTAEIISLIEK